jgi:putative SOS response-associated peptidase YedK
MFYSSDVARNWKNAADDPGMTNVAAVSDLLKPYDARQMRGFPVSTRINSVGNDDPSMLGSCGIYARSESAILIAR